MRVRVTDDAKADLRQIKAYISERNAIAAEGVIDRIRKTLVLLAVLPRLGHPGLVHGTFEKGVPRVPYLIVYRIDSGSEDRELVVLRVYHGAQPRSKYDRL
jgi:plasmid stabilization system protein ParE